MAWLWRACDQLAEQAEELECVNNAREAACAERIQLAKEVADLKLRVMALVRVFSR